MPDTPNPGWRFDNSYARLPERFYTRLAPTPVAAPRTVILNHGLAGALGLDLNDETAAAQLSGNTLPEGAEPLAQAYAGHQFGHFTILGDGRAHLLGEHIAPDGSRADIQLKGSGRTPYSRGGDGRAALGPMLREHIISEAMHGLGIPTTRSLAVIATGEAVLRETPLPGAILTRVASSHLRVGTFQYFAASDDREGLKLLADYAIARHYPEAKESGQPYRALLDSVIERQASLIAKWLHAGFIHGVMNTDNMTISGETIDYGPCAFMNAYDPATVFSSIDRMGRYAYGNQPRIGQWNLARFAEALLPLLHDDITQAIAIAEEAIEGYMGRFERHWMAGMRKKLGLMDEQQGDLELFNALLAGMQTQQADFTNTFRELSAETLPEGETYASPAFRDWHARWTKRRPSHAVMRASNPAIIARNHRVEEALAAAESGDLSVMQKLLTALSRPYDDIPEHAEYRPPPPPGGAPYRTFCGT